MEGSSINSFKARIDAASKDKTDKTNKFTEPSHEEDDELPHVQRFLDLPSKNVLEERSLEPSNKLQMKTLKERSTKNVLRTFQRKHIRTCSSEAFH